MHAAPRLPTYSREDGAGATGRGGEEIAGFPVPQVLFVIIKPTPAALYLY